MVCSCATSAEGPTGAKAWKGANAAMEGNGATWLASDGKGKSRAMVQSEANIAKTSRSEVWNYLITWVPGTLLEGGHDDVERIMRSMTPLPWLQMVLSILDTRLQCKQRTKLHNESTNRHDFTYLVVGLSTPYGVLVLACCMWCVGKRGAGSSVCTCVCRSVPGGHVHYCVCMNLYCVSTATVAREWGSLLRFGCHCWANI